MADRFIAGARFEVYNDLLTAAQFARARSAFSDAELNQLQSSIHADSDGPAMRGPVARYLLAELALPSTATWLGTLGRHILESFRRFDVEQAERAVLTVTPWRYPTGSRLSWHNDSGAGRLGAFVFFVHPRWEAGWGGALALVDDDLGPKADEHSVFEARTPPSMIWPVPNHLVVFRSNTQHSILRVDPSAGPVLRETFTGFIIDEEAMLAEVRNCRQ